MPIVLKHKCGKKLAIDVDMAGKTGTCPQCGGTIVIPEKHLLIRLIQRARSAHLHNKEIEELGTTTPDFEEVPEPPVPQPDPEDYDEALPEFEPEPLSAAEAASIEIDFSDDEPVEPVPQAPLPTPKCPSCDAEIAADAVICINCGTNLQTGEQLQTEAKEEAEEPEEAEEEPDEQPDEGIEKR